MKKLEGNKILSENKPEFKNRYAKIHVLFRKLAEERGCFKPVVDPLARGIQPNLSASAVRVKKFWKDFFGVSSLTQLSDKELHNLEILVEKRIRSIQIEKRR